MTSGADRNNGEEGDSPEEATEAADETWRNRASLPAGHPTARPAGGATSSGGVPGRHHRNRGHMIHRRGHGKPHRMDPQWASPSPARLPLPGHAPPPHQRPKSEKEACTSQRPTTGTNRCRPLVFQVSTRVHQRSRTKLWTN